MRNTVSIENARITFRNFTGKIGQYNREGDRNFCVILEDKDAETLSGMGFNVKTLQPREEGDLPTPYLKIAVGFKFPPKIALVKSNHIEYLTEENVSLLDWAEFSNIDIIIVPGKPWEMNGKTGVKAWLKTMYVQLIEDEFEAKYADVIDSAQLCVGPDCPVD